MPETDFTTEYLASHLNEVHTYESFGRAVVAQAIQVASRDLDEHPDRVQQKAINFQVNVTVGAVEIEQCLYVEVCVPMYGCNKIHVGKKKLE